MTITESSKGWRETANGVEYHVKKVWFEVKATNTIPWVNQLRTANGIVQFAAYVWFNEGKAERYFIKGRHTLFPSIEGFVNGNLAYFYSNLDAGTTAASMLLWNTRFVAGLGYVPFNNYGGVDIAEDEEPTFWDAAPVPPPPPGAF